METFGIGAFVDAKSANVETRSAQDMADEISKKIQFIESGGEVQIDKEITSGFNTDKSIDTRKRFFGF